MSFDADNWLVSLNRALSSAVLVEIDAAFADNLNNDAGLEAFQVVFDWPESSQVAEFVQLPKTVIHFAVDDIDNRLLGLGENQVAATEDLVVDPDTVTWEEAQCHIVNYDIGVWASDKSGGHTSRLVVYQMLQSLLNTEIGKRKLREATGGVEVMRFNGGRFITDRINDVRIFRVIDAELVVRVYSRAVDTPVAIVDMEPVQEPDVEIDGLPIT